MVLFGQMKGGNFMKKIVGKLLLIPLLCLFLPLQVMAADAKLPAGGVTTTMSNADYVDPGFLHRQILFTYQGQSWSMPFSILKDIPILLSDDTGVRQCVIGDDAAITVFLDAINAQLAASRFDNTVTVWDNGAGSYIQQSGNGYYQLNEHVKSWLINMIQLTLAENEPKDIVQELDANFLTFVVPDQPAVTFSSDFVTASSFTTSYKTSSANRCTNIQIASGHLNNVIVMPGETISISEIFRPRTAANGYKSATVYMNGKSVDGIGGGICQVSSTTYNAAMNAGLTVVERHPHSMPVSYLRMGLDATISSGRLDLRIRNDYSAPVIFQTSNHNKNLTVNVIVWNQDLAGRSFKLWSEYTGPRSAKSYLTTYQDGKEVSTRYVASSSYRAHS